MRRRTDYAIKRSYNLRIKYGITQDQYDIMLASQNGKCAICAKTAEDERQWRMLSVDHDHATGKIRGLLCARCNVSLGILENKLWAAKAEKYLNGEQINGNE